MSRKSIAGLPGHTSSCRSSRPCRTYWYRHRLLLRLEVFSSNSASSCLWMSSAVPLLAEKSRSHFLVVLYSPRQKLSHMRRPTLILEVLATCCGCNSLFLAAKLGLSSQSNGKHCDMGNCAKRSGVAAYWLPCISDRFFHQVTSLSTGSITEIWWFPETVSLFFSVVVTGLAQK
jgi:hypothetical protein